MRKRDLIRAQARREASKLSLWTPETERIRKIQVSISRTTSYAHEGKGYDRLITQQYMSNARNTWTGKAETAWYESHAIGRRTVRHDRVGVARLPCRVEAWPTLPPKQK